METRAPSASGDAPAAPPEAVPLRRYGRRFSDEQILEILRAGEEDRLTAADLHAAYGVALPMYCLWKRKYLNLTLPELQRVRRQEARRGRIALGLLLSAIAAVTAGIGLMMLPGLSAEPVQERVAGAPPPDATDRTSGSPSLDAVASPELDAVPGSASHLPSEDEGYVVQIAAMPDLNEALTLVARLSASEHPAYMLATKVGNERLYRVRVGPFETRQASAAIARQLKREGYEDAWLVR